MLRDLEGKTALVGGASQGIGQAAAQVLAERGARILLVSRRREVLEAVRAQLPNPKLHATLPVDMDRTDEMQMSIARLVGDAGPVSIWVNNTGGPKAGPLVDASPVEMERAFRGHVIASQIILRTILPGMKTLGYGRVINVLSTSVRVPIPNLGVSNVVRAAMASWAKTLSAELGPYGITVNNILPGFTETPRLTSLAGDAAQRTGRQAGDVMKDWAETTPAKRLASPRETAEAIAFLASPAAGYINGVSLPVDGGRTGAL